VQCREQEQQGVTTNVHEGSHVNLAVSVMAERDMIESKAHISEENWLRTHSDGVLHALQRRPM